MVDEVEKEEVEEEEKGEEVGVDIVIIMMFFKEAVTCTWPYIFYLSKWHSYCVGDNVPGKDTPRVHD